MKFGPRKSMELADKAIKLHSRGLPWRTVAFQLGVTIIWLKRWCKKISARSNNQ